MESNQITSDFKNVEITGKDFNHIANVLRMKVGEQFSVSIRGDEDGKEIFYEIENINDNGVIGKLCFIEEGSQELPSKIYLFQGLPKVDKMELIIQKAVELGAFEIVPMATKRCVVKLDEKKSQSKIKRWQAIAEAAAKQSKRAIIPNVHMPMTMKEAVQYAKDMDIKLIPYENAEHMDETKKLIEGIKPGENIAVFIGPEGGFSDEEVELCKANDIKPITLGKRILRTETAGFTIISWLMYHLEG
nr:16S rRNA (uracil(1498)-N(3))-methyltransferase [Butyrivibrio proteoclasticus]